MTPTEVRMPRVAPILIALSVLVLAVGLGVALPPFARWLQDALDGTPLPVHGAINLVAGLPLGWSVPILTGLGLVAGAWLALVAVAEALRLTVADDHLEHRTDEHEGWIERSDVSAVFRDGRHLVLVTAEGRVRARLDADDLRSAELRDALVGHGWPWRDEDPYEGDYVGWVDGRPGFTETERALLRRRLRERKDAAAVAELDTELGAHDLAVRVRDDRLQVRRTTAGAEGGARGSSR
ncbi:hypothetical protein [Isoptericola sp. G70]|uniref:YqeB family protein n=1 Tax=Isoptericola sp. G70 TaxID=3376633 RepID=UPI003A80AE92